MSFNLRTYVLTCVQNGMSEDIIIAGLQRQGYDLDEIQSALKSSHITKSKGAVIVFDTRFLVISLAILILILGIFVSIHFLSNDPDVVILDEPLTPVGGLDSVNLEEAEDSTFDSYFEDDIEPSSVIDYSSGSQNAEQHTYTWIVSESDFCELSCVDNLRTRAVYCVDEVQNIVSDSFCLGLKPIESESCDARSCSDYSWSASDWSSCSVLCGVGEQTRSVVCKDRISSIVSDDQCIGVKPLASQSCDIVCEAAATINQSNVTVNDSLSYVLTYSDWSLCSDSDIQTRTTNCETSLGNSVSMSFCSQLDVDSLVRSCVLGELEVYNWTVSNWAECDGNCESATQTRSVSCVDSSSTVVSDLFCTDAKPVAQMTCLMDSCVEPYIWRENGFDTCSQSCGGGTQTQSISCIDSDTNQTVPLSECDGDTMPVVTQACNKAPCMYAWELGNWSTCSKICGSGVTSRSATCKSLLNNQNVSDFYCDYLDLPKLSESCNLGACNMFWNIGDWSSCSTTCGNGEQVRDVHCVIEPNNVTISDGNCGLSKPGETKSCSEGSSNCGLGGWSEWRDVGGCSVACGVGDKLQFRSRTCSDSSRCPGDLTQTRIVFCQDAIC